MAVARMPEAFYDLAAHARGLRRRFTPAEWEALRQLNLASPGKVPEAPSPAADVGEGP